jgi:hypothetical protein
MVASTAWWTRHGSPSVHVSALFLIEVGLTNEDGDTPIHAPIRLSGAHSEANVRKALGRFWRKADSGDLEPRKSGSGSFRAR